MIGIEEARARIRANLPPRRREQRDLLAAAGAVLSEDFAARFPSPAFSNSAMDGFAVRYEDVRTAAATSPVTLKIVGESRAGHPFSGRVGPGEAVQISTGAAVPEGADTVVPVEETAVAENRVQVCRTVKPRQHVRLRGEEFEAGELLLRKGTAVTPAVIGLLASQGVSRVTVYRRPRIAVLVTGSELLPLETGSCEEGKIWDSNSYMLAAAAAQVGGEVVFRDRAEDQVERLQQKLKQAAAGSDLVVVSGGVSVGPHDLVKNTARTLGFEPLFWKVNQKPGKPLFVARRREQLLFGLPGNPVSALMCFVYYVAPAVRFLCGREFVWRTRRGVLVEEAANSGKRTLFCRVRFAPDAGEAGIEPLPRQNSHMLTSVVGADGFVLIGPGEVLRKGAAVTVYLFPWR